MTQILVVEDEAHLAEGLRFNLEAEGYQVSVVETGEAALSGTAAVLAGVGTLIYRGAEHRVAGGDVGPLTRALRAQLVAIQQGEAPDRHGWREAV